MHLSIIKSYKTKATDIQKDLNHFASIILTHCASAASLTWVQESSRATSSRHRGFQWSFFRGGLFVLQLCPCESDQQQWVYSLLNNVTLVFVLSGLSLSLTHRPHKLRLEYHYNCTPAGKTVGNRKLRNGLTLGVIGVGFCAHVNELSTTLLALSYFREMATVYSRGQISRESSAAAHGHFQRVS